MANHEESFAGCVIEVTDESKLAINGKEIDYERDGTKNTWSSRYLPYTTYNSLLEMGKAIARDTVEFSRAKQ